MKYFLLSFLFFPTPAFSQMPPFASIQSYRTLLLQTGSTSFSAPTNWNNSNNKIECIGAGGGGGSADNPAGGVAGTGGNGICVLTYFPRN